MLKDNVLFKWDESELRYVWLHGEVACSLLDARIAPERDKLDIAPYVPHIVASTPLMGRNVFSTIYDAEDVQILGLPAGQKIAAILLHSGDKPIAYIWTFSSLPFICVEPKTAVEIKWDNGSKRIFDCRELL